MQTPPLHATNTAQATAIQSEREAFFDHLLAQLPHSSQAVNADSIRFVIELLRSTGACTLEGDDERVRPGCVGLQCLFEEAFLSMKDSVAQADFEIHTTMPSTPCCKLPDMETKETMLAIFDDEARLMTVDGRSASLDAISYVPHATLHLTYTDAGFSQRTAHEQMALVNYWDPRIHTSCIGSVDAFPSDVNGASYRLKMASGAELYFGIQASQAAQANSKMFTVHLGSKDQAEVKEWIEGMEAKLSGYGRRLFES